MNRSSMLRLVAFAVVLAIGAGCSGSTPSNTGPVQDPEKLKKEADKHREMGQRERQGK